MLQVQHLLLAALPGIAAASWEGLGRPDWHHLAISMLAVCWSPSCNFAGEAPLTLVCKPARNIQLCIGLGCVLPLWPASYEPSGPRAMAVLSACLLLVD